MGPVLRSTGLTIFLLLVLAACTTAPDASQSARLTRTALHLTITGDTVPVLGTGTAGRIELKRNGAPDPLGISFENGTLTLAELEPGEYEITKLGALTCRGMTFDVGSSARAFGPLEARIITTDYYVALMSHRGATEPEIAELADRLQAAPYTIDTRPIAIAETAPCYLSTGGPGTTWRERPLGEKILLGIGFAGFCAIALASGGFCAF